MNEEQLKVIRELRQEGYAIIIWTPEELEDADPGKVEDRSKEFGWEIIDILKGW